MEQKTFEMLLEERLAQPMTYQDKRDGKMKEVMPMEAMVRNLVTKASNGDIPAMNFIRVIQQTKNEGSLIAGVERAKHLHAAMDEIIGELEKDGLWNGQSIEVELLAHQLLALRRVADIMQRDSHRDFDEVVTNAGTKNITPSIINKYYNDLRKQFDRDLDELRNEAMRRKLLRR